MQLNVLGQRAGREQIDRLEVQESAVFKVSAFNAAEKTLQFRLQLPASHPNVSLLPGDEGRVRGREFVR